MKALLSNMGFVLQISGIFLIIPIIFSFLLEETSAIIGLLITAIVFFAIGFMLNAFSERKELTYKQSSALIVLVFVLLSLIGSLPYLYINISQGDIAQSVTDSIFESASGFTTTGFSVISNLSSVPQSILIYRALTQFIGGVGIVLMLLAFFYPDAKLTEFSRSMGFTKNQKIKQTFLLILLIYFSFMIAMLVLGILLGYRDSVKLLSFIFSGISTGGFAPVNDITNIATRFPLNFILIFCMFLGASNFFVLAGLFKRRIKEFFKSEISIFLSIAIVSTVAVTLVFQLTAFDSFFYVISAMSTTGFSYLPVQQFSGGLKILLIFLMFIGGASFSTAGGIKIYRFLLLFKGLKKAITDSITKRDTNVKLFGREYSDADLIQAMIVVILMIGIIFGSAFIVTSYGFQPVDSFFEVTSAIATTGLSVGIIGPSLALELKWLFVIIMILGRVEILAFFIMISRRKEPK